MEPDASLDDYRRAVRARPELAAEVPPPPVSSAPAGAAASAAPHFPETYEVVAPIAETHLSRTWKAWDRERNIHVVIKEPRARLLVGRYAEERFRREVQLASRLMHPNIVPILATHVSEPPWFFTMPLIEGMHLDRFCRERELSIRQRLALFRRVCDAVVHAHQHGVIHRDLKPNNVLVSADGEPQLLDFGLGRLVEADNLPRPATGDHLLGSPGYMAPEQARRLPIDTRTDVYALGVVLYELLTGRLPIPYATDLDEMLRRICETPPHPPRKWNPELSRELSAILLKSLAKDPARRYQSVTELAREIDNFTASRPVEAVRWTPGYLIGKWCRRNRARVAIGAIVVATVIGLVASVAVSRHINRYREIERHAKAVLMGRMQTLRNDPVNASALLWREYLSYDTTRTRFALWELYRRFPCVLSVATGPQRDVEYSPSGRWLVTVGVDGRVGVYDAQTGLRQGPSSLDFVGVHCLKFAPAGDRLFMGRSDGTVRVHAFLDECGRIVAQPLAELSVAGQTVSALAVSGSGRWLAASAETPRVTGAAGAVDSGVHLWDVADGLAPARLWHLPNERASALAFSASETELATASTHWSGDPVGSIGVWSILSEDDSRQIVEQDGPCRAVAFARGDAVLYGGANQVARIDRSFGRSRVLQGDQEGGVIECKWGIRSLAARSGLDPRMLVFAAGDGCICFYDDQQRRVLSEHGYHAVVAADIDVSFAPTGAAVASVSADGLKVWHYPGADAVTAPFGSGPAEARLAIASSGEIVAMSGMLEGGARRLLLWNRTADDLPLAEYGPPDAGKRLAISEAGDWLAFTRAVGGESRIVVAPAADGGDEIAELVDDLNVTPWLYFLDSDARALLLACADGALRLWPSSTSTAGRISELEVVHRFDSACTCVAIDDRRRWLAASAEGPGGTGRVALWRATGRPLTRTFADAFTLESEFATDAWTWTVALTHDRGGALRVATSGSAREINLWDPSSGERVASLAGHRDAVFHCAALGENTLVTASRDTTVRVWDVHELEEVCVLYEGRHEQPVIAVANGRIAIADGGVLTVMDTREIERFLAGNRDYEISRMRGD